MVLKQKESKYFNFEVEKRIRDSAEIVSEKFAKALSFKALGTNCKIKIITNSNNISSEYFNDVLYWISCFESRYSRFLESSLICEINNQAGKNKVEINEEDETLFKLCDEMHFFSRGVFDPSSLPILKLWDYKNNSSKVPDDDQIKIALEKTNWRKVERSNGLFFLPEEGMSLDLGGIGKEYAVDYIAQISIQKYNFENFIINFGQDIYAHGKPPNKPAWHIGLEDPFNPGQCWTGLAISNNSVASSGDYLRYSIIDGKRYSHIINLQTGYPVDNNCRSSSVVAKSCTMAGILSTVSFVKGFKDGINFIDAFFGSEGCLLSKSGKFKSKQFDQYVVN